MKMMVPETEGQLAELVKAADGPLSVQGGGTRGVRCEGEVLSASGLRGIQLYEPGALTIVARAGTPVAEVQEALAAEKQRLAFEPMDHRVLLGTEGEPTIGGVVAANVSGPRRVQVGACRDFLLGVRYVDGTGQMIRNGGRVMKNVTGYDLVKLMAGSWGTLGVLSEVSLKVLPQTEAVLTVHVSNVPGHQGLDAMTRAMKSPFEVTGAAHLGDDVVLRLEGFADSVEYRADRLSSLLGELGDIRVEKDAATNDALWRGIRNVEPLASRDYVWRVSMKPTAMYSGLLAGGRVDDRDVLVDWAGGLCWIGMSRDQASQEPGGTDADAGAATFHRQLQTAVADPAINEGGGGHATLIKAPDTMFARASRFQPEAPALAAISAGLRRKFDPRGIFNRGLMDSPVETVD